MSVLVYAENTQGKFKKSSYEAVTYAAAIATRLNLPLTALSIGNVPEAELRQLGRYGASKVLACNQEALQALNVQPYAAVIAQAARAEGASVVILSASFSGKGIAPRVAVRMNSTR